MRISATMIDLKTLPEIVRTQLRDDPFIYTASNQQQVNIENLAAIVRSDLVTDVIRVLPRSAYSNRPFYLQHTDLFEKAQELFLMLFGVEPDLLIYSYKCDYSSSIFLFANEGLVENAKRKEEVEIIWKGEFKKQMKQRLIFWKHSCKVILIRIMIRIMIR